MSDVDVSKSQVSGDSKKRKAKEAGDVDVERRKKRKRTPHSAKKNKDKDIECEVQSANPISVDPINDVNSSTGKIPENTQSAKKKSHDEAEVEVRESDSPRKEAKANKKKAKTKKLLPDPESVSNPPTEDMEPQKASDKKSKKKDKEKESKYPDPRKDSTLSESETALKALTYVYERLTSHSEWKFNKARQNWILRNIWDENAIPEVYVPSCVKYLKGVQGNSRNVLIKECNSTLEEHSKSEPAKTEGTVRFQEPSEPKAKNEIKYSRAQAILKKLK